MTENTQITVSRGTKGDDVRLMLSDTCVSWLTIRHFVICVGDAEVRMDGIAGVGTDDAHKMKGYSRRVMEAAIEHMTRGDAAITMLYGIRDYYPRFGYATVGPDHMIFLNNLERGSERPNGWKTRPFAASDLSDVRRIYNEATAGAVGAVVRSEDDGMWSELLKTAEPESEDACRVVVDPNGRVRAYAWLGHWCWYIAYNLSREYPEAFFLGEAIADGHDSADALLALCRSWAIEESEERTIKEAIIVAPPEGHLSIAAGYQDARVVRAFTSCGGSMARVLDVRRLLDSLRPELERRLSGSKTASGCSLTLRTEIGEAAIICEDGRLRIEPAVGNVGGFTVDLPQTALARLALGAFPPCDILSRLPNPPSKTASELIETLFPLRSPNMYLPDRY